MDGALQGSNNVNNVICHNVSGPTICGARASYCGGFPCCGARALGVQASVLVALERRLSSCGARD